MVKHNILTASSSQVSEGQREKARHSPTSNFKTMTDWKKVGLKNGQNIFDMILNMWVLQLRFRFQLWEKGTFENNFLEK